MVSKPKKKTTKVTRISASEPKVVVKAVETKVETSTVKKAQKGSLLAPLRAIGGYFKGAWYELRQVRWPNRRATWSLTTAVLIFSAFFVVLILLLDVLFKFLFEQILG